MIKLITSFADNTFGRVFASVKDLFIFLEKNKNTSIPNFYSQHNNDKYWNKRACGIACVQMILDAHDKKISLKKVIKLGLDHNGYDIKNDVGWYHQSLVKILEDFDIKAKTEKYVSSNEIAKYIFDNNFVISSIESKNGGHLILIYDYLLDKNNNLKFLIYNDPWYSKNGNKKKISKRDFEKISKRRIIIAPK